MSKKLLFFTIIIIILLFSGCIATDNKPTIPTYSYSNDDGITMTPTKVSITVTPNLEANIVQHTPDIVATPTATRLVIQTSTPDPLRTCTTPPVVFNYRDTLGISFVTNLMFINEDTLVFDGWAPRQQPLSQETSTAEEFSQGSFNVTFKPGLIDLSNGYIVSKSMEFKPLLANPCQGDCFAEIWGQSPDEMWQIIQVNSHNPDEIGVWLVGLNDLIQLVSYVPTSSQWQWANDSSLLWYIYPDRDYGAFADAIHLTSPLTANFHDSLGSSPIVTLHPINPTNNSLAFDPEYKTIASIGELGSLDSKELYIINVEIYPFEVKSSQIMPGAIAVNWNEATQSYLFNIIQDKGIEFQYEGGSTLLSYDLLNTLL